MGLKIYNCIICNKEMYKKESLLAHFLICSENCKQIRKSRFPKHITPKCVEYWIKKGLSESEARETISKIARKQSVRCVEYWLSKGFNQFEAEKKISEIQCGCSPRRVEHWVARGLSEEEAVTEVSKVQQKDAKKKLQKYSHEERQKQNSFSPKYWISKGMSESDAVNFCKTKSDNMSLPALIKKYGDKIGQEKYNEYCEYRRINYTLSGYIQKHGEEEGEKRWQKRFNNHQNSTAANQFFDILMNFIPAQYKVYRAFKNDSNNREYGIRDGDKYYFCDFVVPELNLCVEFYGDYWHCNPEKYSADFYHSRVKKTAEEIWRDDKTRIDAISRLRNFKIFIVWESNTERAIQTIKEEIQHAIKNKNQI